MKTADLIPFILLELDDSDKYGFELTKNIESKSNGKIIIKQPTLYTLLKKLEKSKFISSYWEDSEIGGKRHYYKLTDNGRLQVSTLPSYNELLRVALADDFSDEEITEVINPSYEIKVEETNEKTKEHISIMDELLNQQTAPIETVLPTNEVFESSSIDNKTELEINLENTDILKDEGTSIDEKFAENKDVVKFTEKTKSSKAPFNENKTTQVSNDIFNSTFTPPHQEFDIKFVDYVDLKNNPEYSYSKKLAKRKLFATLATSVTLFIFALICHFITGFTGRGTLFYIVYISALLIALFYPTIYAVKMDRFRLKYQQTTYDIKLKQRLLIGCTIMLLVVISCVIFSLCFNKNTIASIFSISNFASLYAPILLSSVYFIDILYNYLIVFKLKK